MSIIRIISNHKIKIISPLAGATAITAGSTIPYLMQENSDSPKPKIENKEPNYYLPTNKVSSPKKMSFETPKQEETTSSKLAGLKNEKGKLLSNIENQITHYKNMIKDLTSVKKLEDELNKCFSKEEVKNNITEDEKQKLKNSYSAVKDDIEQYEKLQKEITQEELKSKESDADKDSTDETRYLAFKAKFDEINQEYNNTVNKKSGETLHTSFLNIKSKLDLTTQQCSLKDIIKMNDELGQRNSQ